LQSLLARARSSGRRALTPGQKHHILCSIAVSSTNSGPNRESGANPELPRSGKWERPLPLALSTRRKS
jgi:hypothetical protein